MISFRPRRPAALTYAAIASLALAVMCTSCARADRAGERVRLAIGGQTQMVYLPTTLAQELGYYKDEGLDVELQDFQGGAKALQALVGGSADVVSGYYDHTIQLAAEGRELLAFVSMLRYPGLVLATSPRAANAVRSVDMLKGGVVGVTSAGSSSQTFLTYLLTSRQVSPDAVSVTSIGAGATAVAAMEHGQIDAGWLADPSFTLLKKRNPGIRVLADLRDEAGTKAAFGVTMYPGAALYSNAEWVRTHHDAAVRLARAIVRTLTWMHTHSAQEVADRTPKTLRGDDDVLYVEALTGSMAMFSTDGRMTAEGASAVHALLAKSNDKVRAAAIDLSKTYTNELIDRR